VHGHYAKYRKRLLQAGAEIYEIRAEFDGERTAWGHTPEMITLHSKATVIDRDTIFVGSFNFDPRSIKLNTEMGIFIEAEQAGAEFADLVMSEITRVSYRVDLDNKGRLRWTYGGGATPVVRHKEPQASWGRRFMSGFYGILPVETQL
jgi:putative cardiolipin synthase